MRDVASLASTPARIVSAADPQIVSELGGSPVQRDETGDALVTVVQLIAAGKLDPHVSDVRPLEEAGAALNDVESGHSRGKTALQIA